MRKLLLAFFLMSGLICFAKEYPPMQSAMVVAQRISSSSNGAVAMPIGSMIAAVPINQTVNEVVIEDGAIRELWHEYGRNSILLTVNGAVRYYTDEKGYRIVLDSRGKKHKFAVMGRKIIQAP